jgi:hypothetical protein
MQLERQTRVPLRIGHLEQVDLLDRPRDVEKRVDSTERGLGVIDHALSGLRLGEIAIDDEHFCACGLHRFRRASQVRAIPRDEDERREIAR